MERSNYTTSKPDPRKNHDAKKRKQRVLAFDLACFDAFSALMSTGEHSRSFSDASSQLTIDFVGKATANSATLADSATLGTPITPDALAPMLDTPATVEESNQASTSEIIILDDEEADDDESMADATEDDYVEDKSAAAGKRKAKGE